MKKKTKDKIFLVLFTISILFIPIGAYIGFIVPNGFMLGITLLMTSYIICEILKKLF